jgi:hypothetical protein
MKNPLEKSVLQEYGDIYRPYLPPKLADALAEALGRPISKHDLNCLIGADGAAGTCAICGAPMVPAFYPVIGRNWLCRVEQGGRLAGSDPATIGNYFIDWAEQPTIKMACGTWFNSKSCINKALEQNINPKTQKPHRPMRFSKAQEVLQKINEKRSAEVVA